jgi:hypothetical protein
MIQHFDITTQPYAFGLIVACILWGCCAVGWRGLKQLEKKDDNLNIHCRACINLRWAVLGVGLGG